MKRIYINKRWEGFFTNLLGVILGIVLTFGVSSLLEKREEQKRIKEMMILVRYELYTNQEWFNSMEENMRQDSYVYKKILEAEGDWESIHPDTLEQYQTQVYSYSISLFSVSAWQIFQNSEAIQRMTDKKLVVGIMNGYAILNLLQETITDGYWNEKKKTFSNEEDPYKFFDDVMNNKESVAFYRDNSSPKSTFWNVFAFANQVFDILETILDECGYYPDEYENITISVNNDSAHQETDSIQEVIE